MGAWGSFINFIKNVSSENLESDLKNYDYYIKWVVSQIRRR